MTLGTPSTKFHFLHRSRESAKMNGEDSSQAKGQNSLNFESLTNFITKL